MCPRRSSELIGQGAQVTGHTWLGRAAVGCAPSRMYGAWWEAESEKDVPVFSRAVANRSRTEKSLCSSLLFCYFCLPTGAPWRRLSQDFFFSSRSLLAAFVQFEVLSGTYSASTNQILTTDHRLPPRCANQHLCPVKLRLTLSWR